METELEPLVVERRVVRDVKWIGLNKAARRLGVSRAHLSRVLDGERVSAALQRRMQKCGVTVKDCTK